MTVLEIEEKRLNELVGLEEEEFKEICFRIGFEVEKDGEKYKIELNSDRIDSLSPVTFARTINTYIGKRKPVKYSLNGVEDFEIIVGDVAYRPYIAGMIVKGMNVDEEILKEIIYVQEKLHQTYCRKRKIAAIGIYPLKDITPPIYYDLKKREEISFVPLGMNIPLSGKEILEKHPVGIKYAHLLEGKEKFPLLYDSEGNVLSMPPIINSEFVGKVIPGTNELFVEVTGTRKRAVKDIINMLATMFKEYGAKIYGIKIKYSGGYEISPYLEYKSISVDENKVESLLGIKLGKKEIELLLEKMDYFVENGEVFIQPYRVDILHEVDVIDDISRAYGFDNMEARTKPVPTTGGTLKEIERINDIEEILVGLGLDGVFTFALTSKKDQIERMNIEDPKNYPEINDAKAKEVNMMRFWLLPELLKALRENKRRKLPIELFEINEVIRKDETKDTKYSNHYHLCVVMMDNRINYTKIKQVFDYLNKIFGWNLVVEEGDHPSFIKGRVAIVKKENKEVGVLGEIHPRVLKNFDLEFPVVGLEIELDNLL